MTMHKNARFGLSGTSSGVNLRFIKDSQASELLELYRLARVALSGEECTRYTRMLWASKAFSKENPSISPTAAYKDLEALLAR